MNPFPALYDAHHADYNEDIPFYLELVRQYGEPILELGCGTGRVLHALRNCGYTVIGFDIDLAMLRYLRNRATAQVFCADMTAFGLASAFRLALLPCNTYSTFNSAQRSVLLRNVRRCLQYGGAFVTSFPNPALLNALSPKGESELEEVVFHPQTGNPIQVSTAWQRRGEWFEIQWAYDQLFPSGKVERYTYRQAYALEEVSLFLKEIEEGGFCIRASFGHFDKRPLTSFSPSVIVIAEKLDR
ncbi:MAG: class I SAM-dependent methyltransferase [Anaerolineales bacterium]|nr:class I SAM-dependent methyltransferase [Anaerolineales bacterium]MDW8447844.1 class I SAM-dependent methyltransferase [Anaerolineales bacterium]